MLELRRDPWMLWRICPSEWVVAWMVMAWLGRGAIVHGPLGQFGRGLPVWPMENGFPPMGPGLNS